MRGKEAMIESPVLQGLLAEQMHKATLGILEDRFGPVPADITTALQAITNGDRPLALNRFAARCPDLDTFRRQLSS
jgi:hypothetical protein